MWINRAHFIVIYFRINRFRLPIVIPAFIINSLISEIVDLVNFFTFFNRKITKGASLIENSVYSMCDFKQYDFVDIDIASKEDNDKVRIKICTR